MHSIVIIDNDIYYDHQTCKETRLKQTKMMYKWTVLSVSAAEILFHSRTEVIKEECDVPIKWLLLYLGDFHCRFVEL